MSTRVAVILAAGIGSRLRPLTDDRPKALVEVAGRSILERATLALADHGITRLVVATGYRQGALRHALSGAPFEMIFRHNPEFASTQNSVSLALCRDALEGSSFFKIDGDLLFDPEILARLDAIEAPLCVAVDRGSVDAEAMKVQLRDDGRRVAAFGKAIPVSMAPGESIGLERVSAATSEPLFQALDRARLAGRVDLYYEDVFTELVAGGLDAVVTDVTALRWCEVDSPDDLAVAARLFPG
jgi:choline kinase